MAFCKFEESQLYLASPKPVKVTEGDFSLTTHTNKNANLLRYCKRLKSHLWGKESLEKVQPIFPDGWKVNLYSQYGNFSKD